MLDWLKGKFREPVTSSGEKTRFSVREESVRTNIDPTTVDYIINKYRKETLKYLEVYLQSTEKLDDELVQELKHFANLTFAVINDDYFLGGRLLRHKIAKFDSYVFSQYRHDEKLKANIQKILVFVQNKRFSLHYRQNLASYFHLYEYVGINLNGILKDYYDFLDELKKNKKIIEYLNMSVDYDKHRVAVQEIGLQELLRKSRISKE